MRIQFKHDTESNWNLYGSKVLLDGEIAVVHMTNGETRIKIGDGTTQFSNLKYVNDLENSTLTVNEIEVSNQLTLDGKAIATEEYVQNLVGDLATLIHNT